MGHLLKVFPLTVGNKEISIQISQGFRPNPLTKKIYHFHVGYTTWVITAKKDATLDFKTIEKAIEKSLEIVGAVRVA
jgi:hypothetical protein